jgi:hypothetical protein
MVKRRRTKYSSPRPAKHRKGAGRPTKYDPKRYPLIAYNVCRELGAGTEDLAKVLGVTLMTLYSWFHRHPDFYNAARRGKDEFATEKVETSLVKLATGYEREMDTVKHVRGGKVVRLTQKTYYPPDMTAIMFLLCNRHPDRWQFPNSKTLQLHYFQGSAHQNPGKDRGNGKDVVDAEVVPIVSDAERNAEVVGILQSAGVLEVPGSGSDPDTKAN